MSTGSGELHPTCNDVLGAGDVTSKCFRGRRGHSCFQGENSDTASGFRKCLLSEALLRSGRLTDEPNENAVGAAVELRNDLRVHEDEIALVTQLLRARNDQVGPLESDVTTLVRPTYRRSAAGARGSVATDGPRQVQR